MFPSIIDSCGTKTLNKQVIHGQQRYTSVPETGSHSYGLEKFQTDGAASNAFATECDWLIMGVGQAGQSQAASRQLIVDRITLYFCSNTCHLSAFMGCVPPTDIFMVIFFVGGGSPLPPILA